MKGYIQLYTGNGKGKTTAALGLTLRAVGAGKKVFIGQFVKGQRYSEVKAIEQYLPGVKIKQYGQGCFVRKDPTAEDIEMAKAGLKEIAEVIQAGEYDIVIMEEVNIAIHYQLFDVEDVIAVLNNKPEETEIILTGRYARQELIDLADLVTEMKEVKHYYKQGVMARKGIEC